MIVGNRSHLTPTPERMVAVKLRSEKANMPRKTRESGAERGRERKNSRKEL